MDTNGTHYHLLLGEEDWGSCQDTEGNAIRASWQNRGQSDELTRFGWDSSRSELTLGSQIFLFAAATRDQPSEIDQRRGAARDRYGNWYWIDETQHKVRVRSVGSQQVADFWPMSESYCPPPAGNIFQSQESQPASIPLALNALAITQDQYLAVGVTGPEWSGLLIFDLLTGKAPTQLRWPEKGGFQPFDMAPRPGGGVWILDKTNKCYWALDRSFSIVANEAHPSEPQEGVFQPAHRSESNQKCYLPQSFLLTGSEGGISTSLKDCATPIALEALPDGSVLILDTPDNDAEHYSRISQYYNGKRIGEPISTQVMEGRLERVPTDKWTLRAHDFAFVPISDHSNEAIIGRLYMASQNGNQAFAFAVKKPFELDPVNAEDGCLLMRLFGGKGLVAAGDQVYYDIGERWVPLVKQTRLRYETEGIFFHKFDGKQPGCVWHRLLLDACIPLDTQVEIWSRAADTEDDLAAVPWHLEYLYKRGDGSELPFASNLFRSSAVADETGLLQTDINKASMEGAGTWELLFQQATGRHLQIRVRLSGPKQRTPRLRALRVYYPRFSYLEHYLPAVYRADPESASFLDRFLANTEGFYTAIEDKIASVRQLFDVNGASPETLDWLASWLGVVLDPGWEEARRRLFIRHATLLFQYRGTLPGLQMALRLALDDAPGEHIFRTPIYQECHDMVRIIESFLTRKLAGVLYGDPTSLLPAATGPAKSPYWQPSNGRAELNQRHRAELIKYYENKKEEIELPAEMPYPISEPGGELSRVWKDFSQSQLGFIPAAANTTLLPWQAYLLRTYGTIDKFNSAYGLSNDLQLDSFDEAIPPEELPADGQPLKDWYRFQTAFLPVVRNAHQFSILLPMPADFDPNTLEYQRRLRLASQVIDLEKPAHTTYTIKFFWALFRVGEARLGLDTSLGAGSRSSQLIPPLVLGHGYLGQSYTSNDTPQEYTDRIVLGRGCTPNAGPAAHASVQKVAVKRTSYAYGCTAHS